MKQLTPRQGTKISHCTRFSSTTNETTHTPPGDENQYLMISVTRSFETTHTPSGDENGESDSRCLASTRNNLRPVRGRKSGIDLHCAVQIAKQLTPRQGDERSSVPVTVGITPRNNSHPARGRKSVLDDFRHAVFRNNSHPVRGRKLNSFACSNISSGNNSHPVRGRK